MGINAKQVEVLIRQLDVLVIDDNQYMRNIVRSLLTNIGVRKIFEAGDGIAGLEIIRTESPDIVILDWEMPLLNGPEFVRIVRSPGVFPVPDIPIIMLSGYVERWRVIEAVRLGVNEFLCKPVSAKSLFDRIVSIVVKPRPSVHMGDYYGPEPRKLLMDPMTNKPADHVLEMEPREETQEEAVQAETAQAEAVQAEGAPAA